jgi:RHS repeat-associated protein
VHADHLNTPRLINDDSNKAVWQWPYSAFGDNQPVGILKATTNPANAYTQDPTTNARLQATSAAIVYNMRFAGQYADSESNLFQNFNRSYAPAFGAYTQMDPIGLRGGSNRLGYVGGNTLSYNDPTGNFSQTIVYAAIGAGILITSPAAQQAVGSAINSGAKAISNGVDAIVEMCTPNKAAIPDVQPKDFCEQLALAEAKAGAGRPIMGTMGDEPRLIAHYGPGPWSKREHIHTCANGRRLTIHYFTNGRGVNVELKFV